MPTVKKLSVTFDGTTPVQRLSGDSPVEWFDGSLGRYSVWYSGPKDRFVGTAELTGSDWRVDYMRMASDDNTFIVRDLDAGANRRIKLLELGHNSDVDLISTRVDFVFGWDGALHDVKLGAGTTLSVNLFAAKNILDTGAGWVGNILTGGTDTIIVNAAGAGSVQTGHGNAHVTAKGWVDSIGSQEGKDIFKIGGDGAGALRMGAGNDKLVTGAGHVNTVQMDDGNDTVIFGSGGIRFVELGSGNDLVKVHELAADDGTTISGSRGVDTISFAAFKSGVYFTLDGSYWQNPGAPGGSGDVGVKGWFQVSNFENVTGSNKADTLIGNGKANKIIGLNGNDELFGADGNDTILGGGGKDVIEGGAGNDTVKGQAGADVFVFGPGSGTDHVVDYADGIDKLRIEGHSGGFGTLAISKSHGDKVIVHDGGTIILDGDATVKLTASDFDFV